LIVVQRETRSAKGRGAKAREQGGKDVGFIPFFINIGNQKRGQAKYFLNMLLHLHNGQILTMLNSCREIKLLLNFKLNYVSMNKQ